jgi:hypothetical protein
MHIYRKTNVLYDTIYRLTLRTFVKKGGIKTLTPSKALGVDARGFIPLLVKMGFAHL